jgi:hypothetical protein
MSISTPCPVRKAVNISIIPTPRIITIAGLTWQCVWNQTTDAFDYFGKAGCAGITPAIYTIQLNRKLGLVDAIHTSGELLGSFDTFDLARIACSEHFLDLVGLPQPEQPS